MGCISIECIGMNANAVGIKPIKGRKSLKTTYLTKLFKNDAAVKLLFSSYVSLCIGCNETAALKDSQTKPSEAFFTFY